MQRQVNKTIVGRKSMITNVVPDIPVVLVASLLYICVALLLSLKLYCFMYA